MSQRLMCLRELYEIEDEDILLVDVGRYGLLNCNAIQRHMALRSFLDTYTDSNSLFEGFGRKML